MLAIRFDPKADRERGLCPQSYAAKTLQKKQEPGGGGAAQKGTHAMTINHIPFELTMKPIFIWGLGRWQGVNVTGLCDGRPSLIRDQP